MKRRNFLKNSMHLGAATWLAPLSSGLFANFIPQFAAAEGGKEQFLLVFRLYDGWDVTLGPDAMTLPAGADEKDLFLEYRAEDTFGSNGACFGPSMKPLKPWLDRLSVVNGIFMSRTNVDHIANLDYAISGDSSLKHADFSVEMANRDPRLLGVLSDGGVRAMDRIVPVTRTWALSGLASSVIDPAFVPKTARPGSMEERLIAFNRMAPQILKMNEKLVAIPQATEQTTKAALQTAAAFESGLSNILDIRLGGSDQLDTHSNHAGRHLRALTERFEKIAKYLEVFQARAFGTDGESLLDRTTIYITSEFSREPFLNGGLGKDHNPLTNSAIVTGPGLRGGQVFGKSHLWNRKISGRGVAQHVGLPVNAAGVAAKTKEEAKSGDFDLIRPQNVLGTLVTSMGLPLSTVPVLADTKASAISALLKK